MKKLFIFLFGILLLTSNVFSQPPILDDHYEWGVFITDAKGNKDTLTFGTHPLAKANTLVSEIGEKQITIPDTSVLNFAIDKSAGLKTKIAFGPFLMNLGLLQRGFFMDTIFYLNQTIGSNYEYYAPVFISGRVINFPLTINIRQLRLDSIWYQRLLLWRLYVGEYRQTEVYFQFEEDSFHTKEKTLIIQKSDVKFRSDSSIALYIQFINFITDYKDRRVDEISIFPNPGNNLIHIINNGKSLFKTYSIFDYAGKVIDIGNKLPAEINTSNFQPGFYTIIFKTSDGKRDIKKFVISR